MTRLPKPQAAVRAAQSVLCNSTRHVHSPNANLQRIVPAAASQISPSGPPQQLRQFTGSASSRLAEHSGGEHDSHFDPPSGWLWGVPPDQKQPRESWEYLWYFGVYGSLIAAVVAYAYKPDSSIDTWALEEAKRRLQAERILPEEEE